MKKALAGTGIAIGLLVAATLIASAQTATTTTATTPPASQPMVLQVNKDGKALLRGTIASLGSGTLTVNGWGGTWTVNVGSSVQVLPASAGGLSGFKTGDYVGVQGTVSQSASWTVDATLVRDWTERQAVSQEVKQNVQEANQIRNTNRPRDYVGTASNVGSSSFTLTASSGTAYTVNVAANAEVVGKGWKSIAFSSIQTSDNVRVYGVNASGTIAAQIVRDISR